MQNFLTIIFGVVVVPALPSCAAWLTARFLVANEDARRDAAFLAMFETESLRERDDEVNLLLEDEGHRREIKERPIGRLRLRRYDFRSDDGGDGAVCKQSAPEAASSGGKRSAADIPRSDDLSAVRACKPPIL